MERANCGRDEDVDQAEGEVHDIGEIPDVAGVFCEALSLQLDALVDDWIGDPEAHAAEKEHFP